MKSHGRRSGGASTDQVVSSWLRNLLIAGGTAEIGSGLELRAIAPAQALSTEFTSTGTTKGMALRAQKGLDKT